MDELLGAATEPRFVTGRLEVAAGQGEKPMPYFRPSLMGQGMEQARVRPRDGGSQVPCNVLKASQPETFTLLGL